MKLGEINLKKDKEGNIYVSFSKEDGIKDWFIEEYGQFSEKALTQWFNEVLGGMDEWLKRALEEEDHGTRDDGRDDGKDP